MNEEICPYCNHKRIEHTNEWQWKTCQSLYKLSKMKILHIWDQAGVSCTIAKYQKQLGHIVNVIKSKSSDQMRFLEFYGFNTTKLQGAEFDDYAVELSKDYDIIHVHSISEVATTIKSVYPDKKVFIHYHGSDLRFRIGLEANDYCNKIVDGIFYATPDLEEYLPHTANYIPTIIDTDLFNTSKPIGTGGFTLVRSDWNMTEFKVADGIKPIKRLGNMVYSEMPDYLRQYQIYHEMKFIKGFQIKTLSKTALECLALGLKVLDWNDCIHEGLPEQHYPLNVVTLLEKYYGKEES